MEVVDTVESNQQQVPQVVGVERVAGAPFTGQADALDEPLVFQRPDAAGIDDAPTPGELARSCADWEAPAKRR